MRTPCNLHWWGFYMRLSACHSIFSFFILSIPLKSGETEADKLGDARSSSSFQPGVTSESPGDVNMKHYFTGDEPSSEYVTEVMTRFSASVKSLEVKIKAF